MMMIITMPPGSGDFTLPISDLVIMTHGITVTGTIPGIMIPGIIQDFVSVSPLAGAGDGDTHPGTIQVTDGVGVTHTMEVIGEVATTVDITVVIGMDITMEDTRIMDKIGAMIQDITMHADTHVMETTGIYLTGHQKRHLLQPIMCGQEVVRPITRVI